MKTRKQLPKMMSPGALQSIRYYTLVGQPYAFISKGVFGDEEGSLWMQLAHLETHINDELRSGLMSQDETE